MRFKEITEAPKKKAPTKSDVEKLRYAIQTGTMDRSQAWTVKKLLSNIIAKYAKGDSWEVKNTFLDTGLYFNGPDPAEAGAVQKDVIGALYGFFQDGARKSITKLKRDEDAQTITYTAMPTPDGYGDRQPPQISFVQHKNVTAGNPVVGIHITIAR